MKTNSLIFASIMVVHSVLTAQEFRLETDVFVDNGKEPISSNLTLFVNSTVYDLHLTDPKEVTVFDGTRGRFIVLYPDKKLKTVVKTEEILKFVAEMRARGQADKDKAFFLDPQLEESFDPDTKQLTLKSRQLTYRVKGTDVSDRAVVDRYREFADWYSRLNSMMRLANIAPFARIRLNKSIADRNWIPEEVERTIVMRDGLIERKEEASTRHLVNWKLSNTDRKHIETISEQIGQFDEVNLATYLQKTQPTLQARRK